MVGEGNWFKTPHRLEELGRKGEWEMISDLLNNQTAHEQGTQHSASLTIHFEFRKYFPDNRGKS